MAQTKADKNTFGARVGRINSGKTTRPDGVLTSQREVDAAHAMNGPVKSKKDLVLIPLALGLGIVTILVGTVAGPVVTDFMLTKWPDADQLLAVLPATTCVSIAFAILMIILFNLSTAKRQMAFAAGAAATYFGGIQMLQPIGEQVAMLQSFI